MQFYRQLNPIKALTFDLDDTLYDNHPVIIRAEQAMFDWLASVLPDGDIPTREEWQSLKIQMVTLDPILKHDVTAWRYQTLKHVFTQLGWGIQPAEQAAKQGLDIVLAARNTIDIPAETHRVLTLLSQKLPLIGLTNGNVDANKIGLAEYFQCIYQAGKHGLAKPEADLFIRAAETLKLSPENILHVGDHLHTDVFGAKNHGFQACWYNEHHRPLLASATLLPDVEINTLAQLLPLIGLPEFG